MSISRRQFIIKGLQGTGVLALSIPVISCTSKYKCADTQSGDMIFSTHYFEITKDGQFSLVMDKTDMGQGTTTLFSSLFAEEAEIPLERIQIVPAKVDPAYNTGMGVQITGGSTSTSDRFLTIREAGAFLKATMLYAAAAKTGEPVESLKAEKGHIKTSKILIPYGDLIEWAEVQKINNYPLKDKKDFKILGKERPMVDSFEKSTGKAEYGIDKKLENMVVAVVLRPPHFTARLKSFNYDKLNSQPGFVDCFAIASGVAIVFEKYWQTLKTRDLVDIEWESGSSAQLTSQEIFDRYKKDISQKKGDKVVEEGDLEKVFQSGKTVEAEYHLPYLAHATMEPMNCVAWYQGDSLDIYSPNQGPTLVRNASAALVGLPREKVFVHTTKFLGGGFGRRSTLDYNLEAVEVSKKLKRPVKLMWSREDDMQHSPMRPISYHHFKGSVEKGKILGWQHKYAGQSIMGLRIPQWMPHIMGEWVPDFASQWAGKGAKKFMGAPTLQEGSDIPYSIEHKNIRMFVQEDIAVPIHFWRSVGHSIQGFVTEGFLDELCSEAELDPYAARIDLLKKHPRALGVLKRVAEISNWGKKAGVHQGIAYHKSFNTHVAEVAEVRVENKQIFVDKVYCAVDCGFAVNPTVVQTQLRSAVIYGLSAVLNGEITIENGGVVQSNFHDYEPLRISQSPEIKVSIIESDEDPTGVGEPGLPPIAAAVANAVFKASGVRLRSLPLRLS